MQNEVRITKLFPELDELTLDQGEWSLMVFAFIVEMGNRGQAAIDAFAKTGDNQYLIKANRLFRESAAFAGALTDGVFEDNAIDPWVWEQARDTVWPKWLDNCLAGKPWGITDTKHEKQVRKAIKRAKKAEREQAEEMKVMNAHREMLKGMVQS